MAQTTGGGALARAIGLALLIVLAAGSVAGCARGAEAKPEGKNRHYFIAADEVDWDYAPSDKDLITGEAFSESAQVFTAGGADRIGHVYRKSIYREYTDATFATLKPVAAESAYLGLLGPTIHAEVGDTITVDFKNNTQYPASIHAHGVYYDKDAEGAPYADGSSEKGDDAVPPGAVYTYNWKVPERAGPGPGDPSSVLWMYHSHTDEVLDTYSGLIGAMVITARGKAKADGSPKDVDRELVTLLQVFDENNSHYIEENIQKFAGDPAAAAAEAAEGDEEFGESNLMHGINGYVYGNLPGLTMTVGQHVRWYVIALGTEVDLHTPHWHGNTGLMGGGAMGMRGDMLEILPGSMKIFDMTPDNAGDWLFHCHVNDHIIAGMSAIYHVAEK